MTCEIIDLDDYDLRNSTTNFIKNEDDHKSTNYVLNDAEILDYGVSEDELEETSPMSEEPTMPLSFDTHKRAEANILNAMNSFACIKVVDCNKYPWYYAKYKNQILRRKHFDAVRHARKIIEYLKKDITKQPVDIDVENFSDSSESNTRKENNAMNKENKGKTIENNLSSIDKKYAKLEENQWYDDEENFNSQDIFRKEQQNSITIDIKRNKGLVGMRIKRIENIDATRDMYKGSKKRKTVKHDKTKQIKQYSSESKVKSMYETVDNLCYSANFIVDKAHVQTTSSLTEYNSKTVGKNNQQINASEQKQMGNLKCSLEFNSPKILMKIKKITLAEESASENEFHSDHPITREETANDNRYNRTPSKNYNKLSDNGTKLKKYKPMPKSKRFALEERGNLNLKQGNPKYIEHQSNNKAKLFTSKVIKTSSTYFPTHPKEQKTFNEFATSFKSSNLKTSKKVVLRKNTHTKQVMNVTRINPTKKTTETSCSKGFVKKVSQENQSTAYTVQQLQSTVMKKGRKTNLEEENLMKRRQNLVKKPDHDDERPDHNGILTSKNVSRENFANSTQSDVKKCSKNAKHSPRFPASDVVNATSHSSQSINVNQIEITNTKPGDDKKQSKHDSFPTKFDSTVQSISSSLPQATDCNNYIIPNTPPILCTYNTDTLQNDGKITNHLTEEQEFTKIIVKPPIQPNALLLQDLALPQENCLNQNPEEYILSDNNFAKEILPNMEVYRSHVPQNIPVLTRPSMTPAVQECSIKPNILKRQNHIPTHYGGRFQRPLPLPATTNRLRTPNAISTQRHITHQDQSPSLMRKICPWTFNQYQLTSNVPPPAQANVQQITWNNEVNQALAVHYDQNNYSQKQPAYEFQKLPYKTHKPPGICNVQINNVHWPYNVYSPPFPPPQQRLPHQCLPPYQRLPPSQRLPPPQYLPPPQRLTTPPCQNILNKSNSSSIIGENFCGIVKKINISSPTHSSSNPYDIDGKESIPAKQNTLTHLRAPTNITLPSNNCDRDETISTKSEMMKELEKEMKNVESPVNSEFQTMTPKRSAPKEYKQQTNFKRKSRPGPLSKKPKLTDKFATPPCNTQQISKMGYSPPILPIPTFQNVLSEVKTRVSDKCENKTPVCQTFTVKKPGDAESLKKYGFPHPETSQRKSKTTNKTKTEAAKKISLEEYKKRSKCWSKETKI